jgi:hypothetical protein
MGEAGVLGRALTVTRTAVLDDSQLVDELYVVA